MSHAIDIETHDTGDGAVLVLICSCGQTLLSWDDWVSSRSLVEVNEIAHEHIEASERAEGYGGRPMCERPGHKHPV